MKEFKPGFRISVFDVIFIFIILAFSTYFATYDLFLSVMIFIPPFQFFFFCNLFRVQRKREIIWAVQYALIAAYLYHVYPNVYLLFSISSLVGAGMILYEIKDPGYHGIFWTTLNPDLKEWFVTDKETPYTKRDQS
ncbi:MAG: hypothetical protein SWO11_04505 [Thermodesulfobacteriota bacterium]|nr:hypothetical protein [Thermodesulfobacteriota bacterium]